MRKLWLLALVLLVGCAPKIIAANEDSITLRYDSASAMNAAIAEGLAHCAKHGKKGVPMTGYRVSISYVQVVECR
jgi:hypothetical protein